ncbi:GntR family transcriptional regulator [Paenibacillus sp. R14(2021)]|uniref:GntR family transcriptional regulator n=1 Tax=Paenibacillus sp. R14(2021) TaxID=2859228 RepID=UPI001C615C7B|nr:GntR family transcriptional regulator [Paenibacillus sp. R14(2021)]
MSDKPMLLQVDPDLTFNVNTQIKEQLKWLIGIGQIKPGDMLPAASQLAEQLGLNRNTINWVYSQLRDEGLVTIQKGRGTQVTDGSETQLLRKERQPLQQLLEQTLREAKLLGQEPKPFLKASLAYVLLSEPQPSDQLRILLVECRGHDHPFYRQSIEQAAGGIVTTLFLEDLVGNEQALGAAVQGVHAIVTTLNHAEEVKALFARSERKIWVIGASVDTHLLLEIARLREGAKVAFVCLGKIGGEWMANRVREAGIHQIRSHSMGLDSREQLSLSLQDWDKIYASEAVYTELGLLAPGKVELFPMQLERSSENLLHELSITQ